MIKRYIRQTWAFLKQNKLFGSLYIIGTAIPVALTMIVITFQYIRVGSIYPENHRDELWISERGSFLGAVNNISQYLVEKWFYPLRKYGPVTAIANDNFFVQLPDGQSMTNAKCLSTDTDFFKVFDFKFLAGKPFTESDFHSGRYCAVISAALAGQLFGSEAEAIGKTMKMNFTDYVVTGVVRDASSLTPRTHAQVYVPYTCMNGGIAPNRFEVTGPYKICIRAPRDKGRLIQKEIEEKIRRGRIENKDENLIVEIPLISWKSNITAVRKVGEWKDDDMVAKALKLWGGLLIVFLIVPALNLSGMIAGRMEDRLPEMGICKAFGATRRYLLKQVLNENLVLTLMGGCIGLLISWSILVLGRHWIFDFFLPGFYTFTENTDDVLLRAEMFFSPWIFLSAFMVCAVLNITSALIPAWHALRAEIVYSLNQKK